MGLDWIASARMTLGERENYVRRYHFEDLACGADLNDLVAQKAPQMGPPCILVGAPRLKDTDNFRERMWEHLAAKRNQADQEMQVSPKFRNQAFINHWKNMTLETLMASEGGKYYCEKCPLLRDLQGADSRGSYFLGITVSSCDFRGKRISSDEALGDLADEAFREHDPDAMVDYAMRLELRLGWLGKDGLLAKDPYAAYANEFNQDPFARAMGEKLLTEEEYEKELHWRERNIRDAVHWLRTCAGFGVHMEASY